VSGREVRKAASGGRGTQVPILAGITIALVLIGSFVLPAVMPRPTGGGFRGGGPPGQGAGGPPPGQSGGPPGQQAPTMPPQQQQPG